MTTTTSLLHRIRAAYQWLTSAMPKSSQQDQTSILIQQHERMLASLLDANTKSHVSLDNAVNALRESNRLILQYFRDRDFGTMSSKEQDPVQVKSWEEQYVDQYLSDMERTDLETAANRMPSAIDEEQYIPD
jgi:hypothetical protein